MVQERIRVENGNADAWICLCGNVPESDGFFPSDRAGNEMEPKNDWPELYVCNRCSRIIDQRSLEVIGQNALHRVLA